MTINDVLAEIDEVKPSQYDASLLIKWISKIEGQIVNEIINTHEGGMMEFNGYTENDSAETLIVPDAYADLYKYYLYAMIDYANGETDRYANSMIMFNSAYQDFAAYYNRNHMPISRPFKIW